MDHQYQHPDEPGRPFMVTNDAVRVARLSNRSSAKLAL
jgi:hypothetical protein